MIVLEKPSWLSFLFHFRGSTLEKTWLRIVVTTLSAVVITVGHDGPVTIGGTTYTLDLLTHTLSPLPFTLIGFALSICLGFRNNTSYDRFWEGRKLWGSAVNTSRTWARQLFTFVSLAPGSSAEEHEALDVFRRRLVHAGIAYVHALRMHLRDEKDIDALYPLLSSADKKPLENHQNPPIALLHELGEELREAWRRGWIDTLHLPLLESSLEAYTNLQGGCERIKNTPIPFSYNVLLHRIVAVYCFTLPFGIIDSVRMATPVVVALVAYAFFSLDAVGEEIEDPFGKDPNDLPLDAITRTIEIDLRERLGETNLPKPLVPEKDVLT